MTSDRAHPRYAAQVDARIVGDEFTPARTKNVSRGGLCFEVARALPLDRLVKMRLALVFDENTLSEPLEVDGRVIWCTALGENRHQIGMSFVDMTQSTRANLDMFLRYLREGAK